MSIRTKLALILFLAVGLFLSLDLILLRQSGSKSLALLEASRCEAQVGGIRQGLEMAYDELVGIARNAQVNAQQGSGLLLHPDGTPLSANEQNAILLELDDSDLGLTIQEDGTVVDYRFVVESGEQGVLREVPNEQLSESHPFMKSWAAGTPPRGLFETRTGLMMIGSTMGRLYSWRGLHVRGRWLKAEGQDLVEGFSGCTFTSATLRQSRLQDPDSALPARGEVLIEDQQGDRMIARAVIDGVLGFPVALIQTPVVRNELATMKGMQRQDLLTALGVAIIFPLVLLILIQIVVTGPLGRLTEHAQTIGKSDDAAQRLNLARKDEIGTLASEFDRMLDELERSRREQQRIARMSGRSDVATGVMHGVGNLVNSAGVAAQLASDTVASMSTADLRTIFGAFQERQGELDEYLAHDPQGQHLMAFFEATLDAVEGQVEGAQREVESVIGSVDEVTSLVASLRREETREVVLERFAVAEEVEAAITRAGLREPQLGIRCRSMMNPNLAVRLDRQRLEEILDALLVNATESLMSVTASEREVRIRVSESDHDRIRVSVEDTGTGIPQENLEGIFALKFSTKGEGRGSGLHMASIAATELGGDLHAWSGGVGEGAILTLELPRMQATSAAA